MILLASKFDDVCKGGVFARTGIPQQDSYHNSIILKISAVNNLYFMFKHVTCDGSLLPITVCRSSARIRIIRTPLGNV